MDAQQIRLQQSIKVGLAGAIAVLIINLFHLSDGFFIAISAFVIMAVYYKLTWSRGFQRIIGPAIAFVLVYGILIFCHFWLLYFVMMISFIFIGGYLFACGIAPYASILGSIVGMIVLIYGYDNPSAGIQIGKHFVENAIIGVVIAWTMTWLIWPVRYFNYLTPRLTQLLDIMSHELISKKNLLSFKFFYSLDQILLLCRNEIADQVIYNQYQNLFFLFKTLYFRNKTLRSAYLRIKNLAINTLVQDEIIGLLNLLSQEYQLFSQAVEKRIAYQPQQDLWQSQLNNIEKIIISTREKHYFTQYPVRHVLIFFSMIKNIKEILIDLSAAGELYSGLLNKKVFSEVLFKQQDNSPPSLYNKLFPINIDACKTAFKLTLSFVIIFFLYIEFNLPSNIAAIITAAVLISKPNIGKAFLMGKLRLIGIITGGIAGFLGLFILAHFQHFPFLVSYLFLFFTFAAYVAYGSENIAYAGVQAGIMFPLILLVMNQATPDMTIAIQRFEGAIEGFIVAFIILNLVWPVHPETQLRKKTAATFNHIALLLKPLLYSQQLSTTSTNQLIEDFFQTHESLIFDIQHVAGQKNNKERPFANLVITMNDLYTDLAFLITFLDQQSQTPLRQIFYPKFENYFQFIHDSLEKISTAIQRETVIDIHSVRESFYATLQAIRDTQMLKNFQIQDIENYAIFCTSINSLLHHLKRIVNLTNQIA